MIATVVEESVLGVSCPLTDWEDMLREKAGETVQQGTFIGRILHKLLFWEVSPDIDDCLLPVWPGRACWLSSLPRRVCRAEKATKGSNLPSPVDAIVTI